MLLLLACAAPDADDSVSSGPAASYTGVLSSLYFARADGTVSEGFDLDGEVTVGAGGGGCGIVDYTDPDGRAGVDNGFARLIPALEVTEAAAVEGLIQDSIHSGELLLMYQLDGLDDRVSDPAVQFTLMRGVGTPSLGTDGELEWSQTFDPDATAAPVVTETSLVDGELVAGPIDMDLPLDVLGHELLFHLRGGYFRLRLHEDGSTDGVFSGGVDNAEIMAIATTEDVDSSMEGIVQGLLANAADLSPGDTGDCQRIAIGFEYTGIPAFFFEDSL